MSFINAQLMICLKSWLLARRCYFCYCERFWVVCGNSNITNHYDMQNTRHHLFRSIVFRTAEEWRNAYENRFCGYGCVEKYAWRSRNKAM